MTEEYWADHKKKKDKQHTNAIWRNLDVALRVEKIKD